MSNSEYLITRGDKTACLRAVASVLVADERISKEEMGFWNNVLAQLGLENDEAAKNILQQEMSNPSIMDETLRDVKPIFFRKNIFLMMVNAMISDNVIATSEISKLELAAKALNLDSQSTITIIDWAKRGVEWRLQGQKLLVDF